MLLGAPQLIVAFSWNALLLLAVVLLMFTGFVEELIFRGLLQSVALSALGRWSLLYVSLLFAAMQIGYLSAPVVAFAFGVGLIFAYAARWSGSIVGVALAHGLANVTLFVLMPFLAEQAASQASTLVRSAIAAGSTLAVVALAILIGRAALMRAAHPARSALGALRWLTRPYTSPQRMHPAGELVSLVTKLRELRRGMGITYIELSERTHMPVRSIAEIEHGMRRPERAELSQLFGELGVDVDQLIAAAV